MRAATAEESQPTITPRIRRVNPCSMVLTGPLLHSHEQYRDNA